MSGKSMKNYTEKQIKLIRKFLKVKIQEDNVTFRNHVQQRDHVFDLMKRTVVHGESHSALIIGPRGCGKTTLINSVLQQLSQEVDLANDAIIVKLNGLIHHDERDALKAITAQMQLENAVDGKVFGTFAEQLSFLLSCLTSGVHRRCLSMVFLLEECDQFYRVGKPQTLLYNLFDITHSNQAPLCVLGITARIDMTDTLEKRVKSRFSHRYIKLYPQKDVFQDRQAPVGECLSLLLDLLRLPVRQVKKGRKFFDDMEVDQDTVPIPNVILEKCHITPQEYAELDQSFVQDWNAHIAALIENKAVVDAIEKLCYYTFNEQVFRDILFQLVSKLKPTKLHIDATDLITLIDSALYPELVVKQLHSLSIVELSLVIAMLHGSEVLDNQPLNFEMVLHRYNKFASASAQSVPRPVVQKAFEHLQELELIVPAKGQTVSCLGEHKLFFLEAPAADIRTAVSTAYHLPTEIQHWIDNPV